MGMTTTVSRRYLVHGMTCDHCMTSVREEVCEVAGVYGADVDLASGRLIVTGSEVDDGAIVEAVAEAGYEAVTA